MWPFDDDDDDQSAPAARTVSPASSQGPPVSAGPDPVVRQYLLDKYKTASDDKDVRAAESRQRQMTALGGMLEGIGRIATAGSVARGGPGVDASNVKVLRDTADQQVDAARRQRADRMQAFEAEDRLGQAQVDRDRASKDFGRKEADWAREDADRRVLDDATSDVSKSHQALAARFTGQDPSAYAAMNATQLRKLIPSLEKIYEVDQKAKDRRELAADRAAAAAERRTRQGEADQERQGRRLDAGVEKLGDKIAPLQEMGRAIADVEDELGFNLDDYDEKTGTAGGKELDVPGVSLPLIGRVSKYSDAARKLDSKVSKIFNVTLRDRSGAAVTNQEMERLREEFASGKFNTEEELLGALKAYKRATAAAFQDVTARFAPEAVDAYQVRGGTTAIPSTKPTPKSGGPSVVDGLSEALGGTAQAAPAAGFASPPPGTRPGKIDVQLPKVVRQNGVEYRLNEETGEYE